MTRALVWLSLAALVALAGCAIGPPPEPTLVVRAAQTEAAAECYAPGPEFPALPDRDVEGDEAARDRRAAKDAFETSAGLRAICRASLAAGRIPPGK